MHRSAPNLAMRSGGRQNLIAVALCFAIGLGCTERGNKASAPSPLPPGTDMVFSDGVHFVEEVGGENTWDIKSEKATYSIERGLLNFSKVEALYFENGELAYNIRGAEGSYDSKRKIISLSGEVFGRSASGYTLKTAALTYNLEAELAESPATVQIRGPGISIDGVGLVADFKAEEYRILDSAKVYAEPAKIPKE